MVSLCKCFSGKRNVQKIYIFKFIHIKLLDSDYRNEVAKGK